MTRERKKKRTDIRTAGEELTRELVFPNLQPSYNKFRQQVGPEIDAAISAITAAHQVMEGEYLAWPKDRQAQHVRLFLYTALNNLVLTTHFIVAGYHQLPGSSCALSRKDLRWLYYYFCPRNGNTLRKTP